MEQQQVQQNIGQTAIEMVARERFQQRQKVLEWMLDEGKLPDLRGVTSILPGLKIAEPATLALLSESLLELIPPINEDIRNAVKNTIIEKAGGRELSEVPITGMVFGYTDHPDHDYRNEIQIWMDSSEYLIPSFVLTFAMRMSSERGRSFWAYTGFKPYREEWTNMMLEIPAQAAADEFPRVNPEQLKQAPLGAIFMSRDQRLGIKTPMQAAPAADMEQANLASYGTLTGQVQEDDGKVSLFGPGPQRLAEIAAGNQEELSMGEKIRRLISRGYRMSDADLAIGGKMKVDVRTREDAKHFLDEVFRNGNIWMYNQLNAALEANERNQDFVFELIISGNWQEYRGPIEAEIKLKAYWSKDPVRVHKFFSVSGPMEVGVIVK